MIRTMKFAPYARNRLLAGKSPGLFSKTLLSLAVVVAIGALASPASAQSGSRAADDVTVAREKARAAKEQFEIVKKLSSLGSVSQKQLRDAELLRWLALLDLSNLVAPEKVQQNSLLRARLVLNHRKKSLEVIQKLYQRGAASALELQRAKTARDVAESELKAVQGTSNAERKIHVINAASSKYESAQKEHRLAVKLLQSGSISQAVMDQVKSNLEAAKSELAEAKKSLGARAVEVQ